LQLASDTNRDDERAVYALGLRFGHLVLGVLAILHLIWGHCDYCSNNVFGKSCEAFSRFLTDQNPCNFQIIDTRKCPLRGHCLAPPVRRQRITLKREKNFGAGGITLRITLRITDNGRTDRRGI